DGDIALRIRTSLHGLRAEDVQGSGYRYGLSTAADRPDLAASDRDRDRGCIRRLGRTRRRATGNEAARMGNVKREDAFHSISRSPLRNVSLNLSRPCDPPLTRRRASLKLRSSSASLIARSFALRKLASRRAAMRGSLARSGFSTSRDPSPIASPCFS